MSQRARTRGLALALTLLVALALPLVSRAADDDEAAEEQAEEAEPAAKKEPAAKAKEESYSDEESEDEGEAAGEGDEHDWSVTHRGFYLLANGSYNFMVDQSGLESKAEHAGNFDSDNSNTDDSWGYGGRLGWRFFDRLAVEGQFQNLNSIEIHQHANGRNRRSKATFMTAMANAKGYLLTDRIQPYGLVGVGYGYGILRPPGGGTNDRDQGFAAQFGVGSDFYLTENLGVMTEATYVLPTGSIDDYDYVALYFGVLLRFYAGH
ncbi:MAG TPA: outer membrane beta-barrel protein [Myxococcota bacterium]|nr:outer membrane beta-barrel protein [Myxococcota bacterium]